MQTVLHCLLSARNKVSLLPNQALPEGIAFRSCCNTQMYSESRNPDHIHVLEIFYIEMLEDDEQTVGLK